MSRIIFGVAGGIAAYKACYVLRALKEAGHDVSVVPTKNALQFVGKTTWEALSGNSVYSEVWDSQWEVPHVRLGREADLVLVAPATADLIARATAGRADDLLTNVLLTATCPIVMVPAMHTEMWLNDATVTNVEILRERGIVVIDPAVGRLTGPDSGPGRLPDPEEIEALALSCLESGEVAELLAQRDFTGLKVLISAGGTHEAIDPVRYIGNSSSGRMGFALARAARQRGAEVSLVGANLNLPTPAGVEVTSVVTTEQLAQEMLAQAAVADVIIMAAAPADFTPITPSDSKLKKVAGLGLTVEFTQTTDVLHSLVNQARPDQLVVGFAAETAGDSAELVALGQEKLERKGCQLLVLNDVSEGRVFGAVNNDVIILSADGAAPVTASGSKDFVAHVILSAVQNGLD